MSSERLPTQVPKLGLFDSILSVWILTTSASIMVVPFASFIELFERLEVNVFSWLALENRLHTREILAKKRWKVSFGCPLCGGSFESISIYSPNALLLDL